MSACCCVSDNDDATVEEERWRQVERWAATAADCDAGAALLLSAQAAAPDSSSVAPGDDGASPAVPLHTLDEPQRRALESLHGYRLARGGVSGLPEGQRLRPIPLLALGRLGLATATGGADLSRVEDVMYLSRTMRRCGSLVDGMVGLILARETAAWAADRGTRPTPALAVLAPSRQEVLGFIARDAVETYELADQGLRDWRDPEVFAERARWLPAGVLDVDGELAELRAALADRVFAAAEGADDAHRMELAMAAIPEEGTVGALTATLMIDLGPHIAEAEQLIAEYETFLGRGTAPSS